MAAMATFGPTRKDYVEKYGKEYAADPEKSVYNGPFKMTEWKHGDEMILLRMKITGMQTASSLMKSA